MVVLYPGLCPSNVNKDAKYSVVHGDNGNMEVRLIYRASSREKWLLTTDRHEPLVNMVNSVKVELTGTPGGAFYINEYGHVLVPHPNGGCAYAGTYKSLLKFDYDGREISPIPPIGLRPGDRWLGPKVGVCYVLCAGGNDVKYELVSGVASREVYLSDYVGRDAAQRLARRLATVKGQQGGRIYINEVREFFAPISTTDGNVHLYLGALGDDPWFPTPQVPGA